MIRSNYTNAMLNWLNATVDAEFDRVFKELYDSIPRGQYKTYKEYREAKKEGLKVDMVFMDEASQMDDFQRFYKDAEDAVIIQII